MQATQPENTREIDKYVLGLVARGMCQWRLADRCRIVDTELMRIVIS